MTSSSAILTRNSANFAVGGSEGRGKCVDRQGGGREVVCGFDFDGIVEISSDLDFKWAIVLVSLKVLVEGGQLQF